MLKDLLVLDMLQSDKLSKENIKKILKHVNCMSLPEDILVSAVALKHGGPNALLEFGAGTGGWGFACQYIAGSHIFDTYYLVENFLWANEFMDETWNLEWAKDQRNLEIDIQKYARRLYNTRFDDHFGKRFQHMVIDLDALDSNKIRDMCRIVLEHRYGKYSADIHGNPKAINKVGKIDAIRVDLSIDYTDLLYTVDNILCESNGMIFFDDLNINLGHDRITQLFNLINDRNFYPVFYTKKEGMICRNKWQARYISEKIMEDFNGIRSDIIKNFSCQRLYEFDSNIIPSAKEHKVGGNKHHPVDGELNWVNNLVHSWLQFNTHFVADPRINRGINQE